MFLATANKPKRLLHLSYIGRVEPEELARGFEDLKVLLADFRRPSACWWTWRGWSP